MLQEGNEDITAEIGQKKQAFNQSAAYGQTLPFNVGKGLGLATKVNQDALTAELNQRMWTGYGAEYQAKRKQPDGTYYKISEDGIKNNKKLAIAKMKSLVLDPVALGNSANQFFNSIFAAASTANNGISGFDTRKMMFYSDRTDPKTGALQLFSKKANMKQTGDKWGALMKSQDPAVLKRYAAMQVAAAWNKLQRSINLFGKIDKNPQAVMDAIAARGVRRAARGVYPKLLGYASRAKKLNGGTAYTTIQQAVAKLNEKTDTGLTKIQDKMAEYKQNRLLAIGGGGNVGGNQQPRGTGFAPINKQTVIQNINNALDQNQKIVFAQWLQQNPEASTQQILAFVNPQ